MVMAMTMCRRLQLYGRSERRRPTAHEAPRPANPFTVPATLCFSGRMPLSTRRPTLADAEAICALLAAADLAAIGQSDTTLTDVRDRLSGPDLDLERDAWVFADEADDAGQVSGFAICENQSRSDLFWLDAYAAEDEAQDMLWALAETRAAEVARSLGHPLARMDVGIWRADERKRALAAARGYAPATSFFRMRINHSGPRPAADLPAGCAIEFVGADDRLRHIAHDILRTSFVDHFGYVAKSFEGRDARYAASSTTGWEFVRILSVEGVPAGALVSSTEFVGDENCGYVATLGVLREYRGRGLGRALLIDAFARDSADGRSGTILHVDANNVTPAVGLYESVGMRTVLVSDDWRRTLAVDT